MRRFSCLAVVLCLGLVSLVRGEGSGGREATPPRVEQLIEQLSDRNFHVRESAFKAIRGLGTTALPALQKARGTATDPEVRRRLDELIPPLERQLALMPKLVTLHMTNKPLTDIVNELSKQTGYKIASMNGMNGQFIAPGNNKNVYTFHFDKVPFWEALDKICDAGGLILQQNSWGDDSLRLYGGDMYVPFNYYNGPFKVMATGFYYNRSNNFGQLPRNPAQQGQQNSESLQINLSVAVEPKLPIIKVGMVHLTAAEDDEKHSMLPTPDANGNGQFGQRFYYGGWYRSYLHQVSANLAWPSKTSRTVRLLRGVVPVTLLADQKPSVVTDKFLTSKGKKFKVGAASFDIEDIQELPGKQYQVRMSITEESKDSPNDYNRINSLQQRIELYDTKGHKHPFFFNSINNNGISHIQFTFTIQPGAGGPNAGPPTKMVYYAWVLMEHEVAFEFKDLPLP
jgi:hypothetical protein